ncbi:glycosyltransferase family 2 protein [Pseudonocardia halophobica]|uniref:glycosyltransferase family 2 protein n=1 Tax=Pseudonocardia halophobica TaxID=29401 RepID=UPI003D94CC6C
MHGQNEGPAVAPTVSVVVPTLNESHNIGRLLAAVDPSYEVVVSDGGSVDGTPEAAYAARPSCRVVRQSGRGRGDSMLAGLRDATGDVLVTLDADGSAGPHEVARAVAALESGADLAKGSRIRTRKTSGGTGRTLADLVLASTAAALLGTAFADICCGLTAVRRSVLPRLGLPDGRGRPTDPSVLGDGVEFDVVLAFRAIDAGLSIQEIPDVQTAQWYECHADPAFSDRARILRALFLERRRAARAHRARLAPPLLTAPAGKLSATGVRLETDGD